MIPCTRLRHRIRWIRSPTVSFPAKFSEVDVGSWNRSLSRSFSTLSTVPVSPNSDVNVSIPLPSASALPDESPALVKSRKKQESRAAVLEAARSWRKWRGAEAQSRGQSQLAELNLDCETQSSVLQNPQVKDLQSLNREVRSQKSHAKDLSKKHDSVRNKKDRNRLIATTDVITAAILENMAEIAGNKRAAEKKRISESDGQKALRKNFDPENLGNLGADTVDWVVEKVIAAGCGGDGGGESDSENSGDKIENIIDNIENIMGGYSDPTNSSTTANGGENIDTSSSRPRIDFVRMAHRSTADLAFRVQQPGQSSSQRHADLWCALQVQGSYNQEKKRPGFRVAQLPDMVSGIICVDHAGKGLQEDGGKKLGKSKKSGNLPKKFGSWWPGESEFGLKEPDAEDSEESLSQLESESPQTNGDANDAIVYMLPSTNINFNAKSQAFVSVNKRLAMFQVGGTGDGGGGGSGSGIGNTNTHRSGINEGGNTHADHSNKSITNGKTTTKGNAALPYHYADSDASHPSLGHPSLGISIARQLEKWWNTEKNGLAKLPLNEIICRTTKLKRDADAMAMLSIAKERLFDPCGLFVKQERINRTHNAIVEVDSKKRLKIAYRLASASKTALLANFERKVDKVAIPFDAADDLDLIVILVPEVMGKKAGDRSNPQKKLLGAFIFPFRADFLQDSWTREDDIGSRYVSVFPPFLYPTRAPAVEKQKAQAKYWYDLSSEEEVHKSRERLRRFVEGDGF